jgi:hypothetical protein
VFGNVLLDIVVVVVLAILLGLLAGALGFPGVTVFIVVLVLGALLILLDRAPRGFSRRG